MGLRAIHTWSHLILSEIHEELPCYDHRPETWGLERLSNSWFVFFFFNLSIVYLQCCVWCGGLVAQSCPTLCDPSVHEILQTRVLEQVAISISRGFSWPRDRAWVSCIGGQTLYQLHHLGSLLKCVGVKTQLKRYRDADPVQSTLGTWGPSVWWLLLISSEAFSLVCGRKKGERTSIY